jgi:hypothetical protein
MDSILSRSEFDPFLSFCIFRIQTGLPLCVKLKIIRTHILKLHRGIRIETTHGILKIPKNSEIWTITRKYAKKPYRNQQFIISP